MPSALPPAVRQAIWNCSQAGRSVSQIAEKFEVSERTVRRLLRDVQSRGDDAFQASYDECGVRRSKEYVKLRRRTLKLRGQHPTWGAGRLLLELAELFPNCELPCERTVARWLREEGIRSAPAGRPAQSPRSRAEVPHNVWQLDAAEQKRLATDEMISWLRVADECSGAVLKTVVFSRGTLHARSAANRPKELEAGFYRVGNA